MINLSIIICQPEGGLMTLKWTIKQRRKPAWMQEAQDLYALSVNLARQTFFYTHYSIPDTPEGRYELLTLHLFLILHRLKKPMTDDPSHLQEISQEISNLMVIDLDHSLRTLRLSELKMARQFKQFVEGFYGRLIAYDDAFQKDENHLQTALFRNIYGNCGHEDIAHPLTLYTLEQGKCFSTTPLSQLIKGKHHVHTRNP